MLCSNGRNDIESDRARQGTFSSRCPGRAISSRRNGLPLWARAICVVPQKRAVDFQPSYAFEFEDATSAALPTENKPNAPIAPGLRGDRGAALATVMLWPVL
jgi:hypothetical protein